MSTDFSGVFTALVTPFLNGKVDFASLEKLVAFQLENGIEGFVVHGTTGESPTVTDSERKEIFSQIKKWVGGKVPLLVGTGGNSTDETVTKSKLAEAWGADGVLVVVPYYNKPPQRGLILHFQTVASSIGIPVVLYNVPSRTVARLELESIVELSRYKNIVGIKEATGDIEFGAKVVKECGEDFLVTSGDDATCFKLMEKGGRGVISVASHILPKQFVGWKNNAIQSKLDHAEFSSHLALIDSLYVEANPIPVKMALYWMGIIKSPELRLPLVSLSEAGQKQLKVKMLERGLLRE